MFVRCTKTFPGLTCVEGNHKVCTAPQCWFASCFMFVITLMGAFHFMMQPNLNSRKFSQRHKLFSRAWVKSSFCAESMVRETWKSVFYKNRKACRATPFSIHRHTHVDMYLQLRFLKSQLILSRLVNPQLFIFCSFGLREDLKLPTGSVQWCRISD